MAFALVGKSCDTQPIVSKHWVVHHGQGCMAQDVLTQVCRPAPKYIAQRGITVHGAANFVHMSPSSTKVFQTDETGVQIWGIVQKGMNGWAYQHRRRTSYPFPGVHKNQQYLYYVGVVFR